MTALALSPARAELISADDIEERLIEMADVEARRQGRPGSQWAGDGPWYLSRGIRANRLDAIVGALENNEDVDVPVREPLPDRDLITRAEEAGAWLFRIADNDDRRLVQMVVAEKAARGGVRWHVMLRAMDMKRGKGGLEARYRRVLTRLAFDLNG